MERGGKLGIRYIPFFFNFKEVCGCWVTLLEFSLVLRRFADTIH